MPKIDMEEYNAADAGGFGFKQLVPGAYVCIIQAVRLQYEEMDWELHERVLRSVDTDKSVLQVFDIAEGEFCGEFSRDFYMGADGNLDTRKDFLHSVKYDWSDISAFKKFNQVLEDSNPGFSVMAAFQADKWSMYVGKKFGIVLNGTVTTNERGYDQWKLYPAKRKGRVMLFTVDEVRDGKTPEPRIIDKRTPAPAPESTYLSDDDLPFTI